MIKKEKLIRNTEVRDIQRAKGLINVVGVGTPLTNFRCPLAKLIIFSSATYENESTSLVEELSDLCKNETFKFIEK